MTNFESLLKKVGEERKQRLGTLSCICSRIVYRVTGKQPQVLLCSSRKVESSSKQIEENFTFLHLPSLSHILPLNKWTFINPRVSKTIVTNLLNSYHTHPNVPITRVVT